MLQVLHVLRIYCAQKIETQQKNLLEHAQLLTTRHCLVCWLYINKKSKAINTITHRKTILYVWTKNAMHTYRLLFVRLFCFLVSK